MGKIKENLSIVNDEIAKALKNSGRDQRVKLIAVSKTIPAASVEEAFREGQISFGENYVQEALQKIESLKGLSGINWYFIGSLQSNKVKYCIDRFAMIQSVDREKVALAIDREVIKRGIPAFPVLIEVNISGEKSKSGIPPKDIYELLKKISPLEGIRVKGLMTMPPYFEEAEDSRPYFVKLRKLRDEIISSSIPNIEMTELSMGMSNDYMVAVEEGATMVRVGTAIFGNRL